MKNKTQNQDSPSHPDHEFLQKLMTAVQLEQDGNLETARNHYEELLKQKPTHYLALSFMGSLECREGSLSNGEAMLRRSIDNNPNHWLAYNNLGNALVLKTHIDDAEKAFKQSISRNTNALEPLLNLGFLSLHKGVVKSAEEYFLRAQSIDSEHPTIFRGLSKVYERQTKISQSIQCYEALLQKKPGNVNFLHEFASLLSRTGYKKRESDVYHLILSADPKDAQASHMLAALSGDKIPEKASDDYVTELFDDFATSFDQVLTALNYQAPRLIGDKVKSIVGNSGELVTLDAGCGTGRCGNELRPIAGHLTGIDLSAGMLKRARALQIYDELEEVEIEKYLESTVQTFDLIVSADTLVYFGELLSVCQLTYGALNYQGVFVFTLEAFDEKEGYRLEVHGRYSHSYKYLESTLYKAGFQQLEITEVELRLEGDQPVRGWLVTACKCL